MHYAHLTKAERYQIEVGIQAGLNTHQIGRKLGRNHSTISREIKRGGHYALGYSSQYAQQAAERRARRSAANARSIAPPVRRQIAQMIRRDWSPEQVCGYLERFKRAAASVPTIYSQIRRNRGQGGLLYEHLRYGKRPALWGRHSSGGLPSGRTSIRHRPAEVEQRRVPGHWEGDTLIGSRTNPHHLLSLVERSSRFVRLRRPEGGHKLADRIARTAVNALQSLLTHSITFDNGSEFAAFARIAKRLGCQIYFADTHSPWQRGTCENTIGLVRQYIPKGTSGRRLTNDQIQSIEDKLNQRPRKCLGYKTPAEVLLGADPPVALRT